MSKDDQLDFAKKIVESIIESLKENIRTGLKIEYKSKFDLLTEMDRKVENKIVTAIQEEFPKHDIVAEESAASIKGSDHVWYIDPISGSTNYAHSIPIYGVSLALKIGENIEVGAIYNSVEDEVFYAERGKGAYVGGKKLSISDVEDIEKSIVSTSFPYDDIGRKKNLQYFNEISPKVEGIRRTGSVAVDFSYLALGVLDGFWAVGLEPWDTAACVLIVEESGGRVSSIDGKDYELEAETILASNGKIHEEMKKVVSAFRDKSRGILTKQDK